MTAKASLPRDRLIYVVLKRHDTQDGCVYRLIRVQETNFLLFFFLLSCVWRELSRRRGCHDGWDGLKISPKTLSIKSDATSNCEEAHHFVAVRFFWTFQHKSHFDILWVLFDGFIFKCNPTNNTQQRRRRRKNLTDFRHDPANTSAPFVRPPKSPPASCFSTTIRSTSFSSSYFAVCFFLLLLGSVCLSPHFIPLLHLNCATTVGTLRIDPKDLTVEKKTSENRKRQV